MMPMGDTQKAPKASPLQVAKTVLWSFLGIRKRSDHDRDTAALTPAQVVVAGIAGTIVLVLSLITLVHFIAG